MLSRRPAAVLTAISENHYLAAVRTGMVAVVPLTIVGGLFMIVAFLPVPGWEARIAPYLPLLRVPVAATFGVLAVEPGGSRRRRRTPRARRSRTASGRRRSSSCRRA